MKYLKLLVILFVSFQVHADEICENVSDDTEVNNKLISPVIKIGNNKLFICGYSSDTNDFNGTFFSFSVVQQNTMNKKILFQSDETFKS